MINRKFLVTTVLSVVLIAGSAAMADSNDLLRMDIKKASSEDTVDVTFYTTGGATNSVVTRKSGNTYVVLLPNVSGNQSIVPSLGGVKDLVSNVSVKNVDDTIGGYTKVTFNTTKPVKIQTYTKRTAPLTKAQQDYKNLIAQNSKFDPDKKMENFKKTASTTTANTSSVKAAVAKAPAKTVAKPAEVNKPVSKTTQNNQATSNNKVSLKPVAVNVPVVKPEKVKVNNSQVTKTQIKENKPIAKNTTQPKVEATPKVAETNTKTAEVTPVALNPAYDLKNPPAESKSVKADNSKKVKNDIKTKERKKLPIMPIAGALSVVGIFILGGLINIIARAVGNNSNKLKEYLENYNSEDKTNKNDDYQEILEKDNLNWQEKYKLYSEIKDNPSVEKSASYVANMSGTEGAIVDDVAARVSQMEHAYSQTPSLNALNHVSKDVQSEDDAITSRMSGLKLKSFAKNINLKETSRHNIESENIKVITEPLKESKFVTLKNTALSLSQRNVSGHGFSISDLVRKGRRFLPQNNNSENIDKAQEQYLLSSIEEYLDILDNENVKKESKITEEITNLIPRHDVTNTLGVTNPLSKKQSYIYKQGTEISKKEGFSVKSKYDIDSDKSIFMVDSDGVSAIIGKIGENIFVLKKFDKIINKSLQVRLDYGSVYIVKVGGFKCLVDVAEDKMGTLLEI